MAITFDSLQQAKGKVLGYFRGQVGNWGLGPRDFFGKMAAVATLVHYQFLRTARQIDLDAVPTSKTSTAGIDEWAENGTGIPNGAGGYGRKVPFAATGGVGTFTGTPGTVYPALSTLTASDGVTKFQLTNGPITVGGGGTVSGNVNATTVGVAGNQPTSAVLTVDAVPIGGNASVTLTTGLSGGFETEGNDGALGRIQARIRNQPKALTGPDLRSVAEAFVARAYPYPRRNGTGTWDLVLTESGSGQSRIATAAQIASVTNAFVTARNVTVEGARYLAPYMPNGAGLAVRLRCKPSAAQYNFDWDSTAGTWTVDTIVDTTHIKLSTVAPADLKAAIDAQLQPRIQVVTTGTVLPQELRCIGWADGGGKTTLQLAGAGYVNIPTVGDAVHSGGPVVQPIATAVLALVDGLGPSRLSGYPDAMDSWDDTLRIDQLRRVALDALDGDGITRMVIGLLVAPTINGAGADVEATDDNINPPALLYLSSIAVTP